MKVKALKGFSSPVFSMHEGQVKECNNKAVLDDLLRCGYIEKVTGGAKKSESERDSGK